MVEGEEEGEAYLGKEEARQLLVVPGGNGPDILDGSEKPQSCAKLGSETSLILNLEWGRILQIANVNIQKRFPEGVILYQSFAYIS